MYGVVGGIQLFRKRLGSPKRTKKGCCFSTNLPGLFAADKLAVFLTWAILFVSLTTNTANIVVWYHCVRVASRRGGGVICCAMFKRFIVSNTWRWIHVVILSPSQLGLSNGDFGKFYLSFIFSQSKEHLTIDQQRCSFFIISIKGTNSPHYNVRVFKINPQPLSYLLIWEIPVNQFSTTSSSWS